MTLRLRTTDKTYTHFTVACGIGGITAGLNKASAKVGQYTARTRSLGGIDVNPAVCRDFERITGSKATCMDLFDLEGFRAFHGPCKTAKKRCPYCHNTGEPPAGWTEATPDDIRAAAQGKYPDIVCWSPPCKGYSGLRNRKSTSAIRYAALNELTVRALILIMEAFRENLPSLMLMENVPLIATQGRELLDVIRSILESYGYAVAETVHDCGKLGGLAQHRRRFLLVARLRTRVKPFVYEPPQKRVRGVGEVIGSMPLPDAPEAGPMHRLPRLQWQTWLRLALVEAGKDWRSLNQLDVADGYVQGLRLVETQASRIDDPRATTSHGGAGKYRVTGYGEAAGTVIGSSSTGMGAFAVADPRAPRDLGSFEVYGVKAWDQPSGTVTGKAAPGAGHFSVADPRLPCDVNNRQTRRHNNVYKVVAWDEAAPCVTGATGNARPNVADPRPGWNKTEDGSFATSGHYGVRRFDEPVGTITGHAKHDRGAFSVADPRLPNPKDQCTPVIVSLDGTRHRPFTTLELAALQGFPMHDMLGQPLVLEGKNDAAWRMGIGNAVPVDTAAAFGSVFLDCLLRQEMGQTFSLSAMPVWVRPVAGALSIDLPTPAEA